MRELLGCVFLWGCIPRAELDLPDADPPPEVWVIAGELDGQRIAHAFPPGEIAFIADTRQPISAIAYSISLEDLQLRFGPLRLTDAGRELSTTEPIARAYTSDPSSVPRAWTAGIENGLFIEELDPRRCFERGRCRPAGDTFSYCESTCGAERIAPPAPPLGVGTPTIARCPGDMAPFITGCARIGPECPADWPEDLPADARMVESGPALIEAVRTASAGATIAVRGLLEVVGALRIDKPLTFRGTCVEDASIPELQIASIGVSVRALRLVHLLVETGGDVEVDGSQIDVVTTYGHSIVRGSAVSQSLVERGAAEITDSYLGGKIDCFESKLNVERTTMRNAAFTATDCMTVLSDVAAERSQIDVRRGAATIQRTTSIESAGAGPALAAVAGDDLTLIDVMVRASGPGVEVIDTIANMQRVVVVSSTSTAMLHRMSERDLTLIASDLDLEGANALALLGNATIMRARLSARSTGIDASAGGHEIVMEDLVLDADEIGILAAPETSVTITDFRVEAPTAVFVPGTAERLSFRRGTIDSPEPLEHEGDRLDDFFIQTLFEGRQ